VEGHVSVYRGGPGVVFGRSQIGLISRTSAGKLKALLIGNGGVSFRLPFRAAKQTE
jgi:hypothetical protein